MVIEMPGMALKTRPTMRPGTIQPQEPAEVAISVSAPTNASMSSMPDLQRMVVIIG